jgi:hypothetical protein
VAKTSDPVTTANTVRLAAAQERQFIFDFLPRRRRAFLAVERAEGCSISTWAAARQRFALVGPNFEVPPAPLSCFEVHHVALLCRSLAQR